MKTLTERIKEAQALLTSKRDALTDIVKQLEEKPDDETLSQQVESLTAEIEKGDAEVEVLIRAEKALAAKSRPVDEPRQVQAPYVAPNLRANADPRSPGDVMFKHATIQLLAFAQRKSPEEIIEERYKGVNFVKATWDYIAKTAVPPARTDTATWAQELVRTDVRGFMDTLKDVSVAAALMGRTMNINFGGANAVTVPKRVPNTAGGGFTEPAWVGEGGPIPLTRFTFGSTTLNRFKLAAITTMTKEIVQRATPDIEAVLRDALREAYAEVLDTAFLGSGAAVANLRPAGLQVGAGTAAGVAGGGEDAVRGDILAMLSRMTTAKLGQRPVLLINNLDRLGVGMMTSAMSDYIFRDELASGSLLSIPVISSANIAQHLAIMVDAAYIATAFDMPEFDVSDVATVVEANADTTAPTHAVNAAGVIGTGGQVAGDGGIRVAQQATLGAGAAGYTARSLWQTWSLGIRMVCPTSWAVMQTGAVQTATATTWTA